MMIKSLMDAI